uniref:Reverse transcriptase domain-containing protein n=1 Tax=Ditylenchus dipsaci TaxID=166011 RepID=A0A915DC07_9BILA
MDVNEQKLWWNSNLLEWLKCTLLGLFAFNRLPFGDNPAPAIYQRIIDSMLSKLNFAIAYMDDIIVVSKEQNRASRQGRPETSGTKMVDPDLKSKSNYNVASVDSQHADGAKKKDGSEYAEAKP